MRQLAENARTKNIEVILNPASGPGKKPDPAYVKVASDLRKARGKILGYVSTNYAKRDIAAIEQDVRAYASFYEVDGIFLDEMSGAKDFVLYYLKVRAMIKSVKAGFRIVGNPGQPWVDEGYMKAVDCRITFEGSAAKFDEYYPSRASPWMKNYPARRFAIVVHTAPSRDSMKKAIRKAAETRAGWVFITNREMPNPYDAPTGLLGRRNPRARATQPRRRAEIKVASPRPGAGHGNPEAEITSRSAPVRPRQRGREVATPHFGDIGDTALRPLDLEGGAGIIGPSLFSDANLEAKRGYRVAPE